MRPLASRSPATALACCALVAPLYLAPVPAAVAAAPQGVWVVDPFDPGPDLPPRGRSDFDLLFTAPGANGAREYRLPFPFTELVARLEAQLPLLPGGGSSLKKVLIPLGRSLQRNAAAPDFFASPRVVIAVDSEPDPDLPRPMLLKDRLFIGYQEAAAVLEVISYNEEAARFEFQVVEDYRAGGRAAVRYANRALCTSCHQNGGPIFSEAGWEETNSESRIAERLADLRQSFHGVPARRSSVDAAAIDNATNRANLLPAYQLLWREGCGDDAGQRRRCRASAFTAMLQYRLNAFSHFDTTVERYREDFQAVLGRQWRERWPGGLIIPNPDIPNRAPPFITRSAEVPREFDPLNTRDPLTVWRDDGGKRLVTGLAELLPARDVRLLDRGLRARARRAGAARRVYRGPCAFEVGGMLRSGTLLQLDCRLRDARARELALVADATVTPRQFVSGAINTLSLSDGTYFSKLVLVGAALDWDGPRRAVDLGLQQRRGGLSARLADGNVIEGMRLQWQAPDGDLLPGPGFTGTATLTVLEDFAPVAAAVAALAAPGAMGAFDQNVFRGPRLMQALLRALELARTDWCCELPAAMPPALAVPGRAEPAGTRLAGDQGLRTFYQYCGACHRGDTPMPPGFLRGDREQVADNLRQCAPRILYRLGMWQVAENERPKSPMPPAHSLPAAARAAGDWARSGALAALRRYAATGTVTDPNQDPTAPYETLPACLPGVS